MVSGSWVRCNFCWHQNRHVDKNVFEWFWKSVFNRQHRCWRWVSYWWQVWGVGDHWVFFCHKHLKIVTIIKSPTSPLIYSPTSMKPIPPLEITEIFFPTRIGDFNPWNKNRDNILWFIWPCLTLGWPLSSDHIWILAFIVVDS